MKTQITPHSYREWVEKHRPDYMVLDDYVNTKVKLKHLHKSGIVYFCSPEKFKMGHNPTILSKCPILNEQQYKQLLKSKNIELIGEYKSQNKKTLHKDVISGKTFISTPKTILKSNYTFRNKVSNDKEYKEWISNNYSDLQVLEPYITSHTKIKHLHTKTGVIWNVKPNNVINGQKHPSDHLTYASLKSIKWLESFNNKNIQHVLNGGEYKIHGIGRVDGFDPKTNTVYEFHGDFWHGNPTLFESDKINPVTKTTFGFLYENTKQREQKIKQQYNLVTIWESEYE